jgi:hypothetical protein
MEIELSERTRRVLQKLRPAAELGESIEAVALEVLRLRLREVADELGSLEARYGRTFEQFAEDWRAGSVPDRFSRTVERDFMEWEAMVAERHELLGLIRELASSDASGARSREVRS